MREGFIIWVFWNKLWRFWKTFAKDFLFQFWQAELINTPLRFIFLLVHKSKLFWEISIELEKPFLPNNHDLYSNLYCNVSFDNWLLALVSRTYSCSKKYVPPYNISTFWLELSWAKMTWFKNAATLFIKQATNGDGLGLSKELFALL